MNKTEIRDEWEKRIAAYKSSGLSASAWCAANNLKTTQLWYWLRKFKTESSPTQKTTQWMSVEINNLKPQNSSENTIIIKMGQAFIEVKQGFDKALLADVIRILSSL